MASDLNKTIKIWLRHWGVGYHPDEVEFRVRLETPEGPILSWGLLSTLDEGTFNECAHTAYIELSTSDRGEILGRATLCRWWEYKTGFIDPDGHPVGDYSHLWEV